LNSLLKHLNNHKTACLTCRHVYDTDINLPAACRKQTVRIEGRQTRTNCMSKYWTDKHITTTLYCTRKLLLKAICTLPAKTATNLGVTEKRKKRKGATLTVILTLTRTQLILPLFAF